MKKKIMLFILIYIFLFINVFFMIEVKADYEVKSTCAYKDGSTGSVYSLTYYQNPGDTPLFTFGEEAAALINYNQSINIGPAYSYCNGYTGDIQPINNVERYINDGKDCPPYIGILYNNGGFVAIAFDENPTETKCFSKVFEHVEMPVEIDNEGIITDQEDYKLCKFNGEIKGRDFSFNLNVNNTKQTISIMENALAETLNYNDFKNVKIDTKTKCFEEIYVCEESYSNGTYSHYAYPSMESYCKKEGIPNDSCNEQHLDNCAFFSGSESSAYLITKGCKPYSIFYSKYLQKNDLQSLNNLRNFCRTVLANSDYTDKPYSCVNLCISLSGKIMNFNIGECGFSDRLMAWVDNILKWIKYILPVIVIVLGIIDFIKAIAEEKDDEMKKAQGRFVKRLIAAALAFLIPFIIQFILEKFGFISDSCGLW